MFEMPMFKELDIETHGSCNRFCTTCLRNSLPDREAVAGRFGKIEMLDDETVYSVIDQAADMGFTGMLNFSHFNEPLLDSRLADFGRYAKAKNKFYPVTFHSNFDHMVPWRAVNIDNGAFDAITVALYDDPSPENMARLQAMLPNTPIRWTGGEHVTTHYSPWGVDGYIEAVQDQPCRAGSQRRMIIDYRGNMLLCCEDVGAYPTLGNVHDTPLRDLWYSEKHVEIVRTLNEPGGRHNYGYCRICPRGNEENL